MRFGFFSSDGFSLRYFECGEGEALILVHGLGESLEGWTYQYDEFSKICRTIALDLRGFGMSEVPDSVRIEDFASDVKNLMDYLEIDSAHILGMSMGGVVCLAFYDMYPERVKSLILANTLCYLPDDARAAFEERLKLLKSADMKKVAEFIAQLSLYRKDIELLRMVVEIISRNDKEYYTMVTEELTKVDFRRVLGKITVPTLVIVAEHDVTTPPAYGEFIAANIPNAELKVIRNAAHLAKVENHAEFNAIVVEFLRRVQA